MDLTKANPWRRIDPRRLALSGLSAAAVLLAASAASAAATAAREKTERR